MTAKTLSLTSLESVVLAALFESAKGNGHDFGFIEDARKAVKRARQLSGAVASLTKKGVLKSHESVQPGEPGTEPVTQFTWVMELDAVKALLAQGAAPSKEELAKAETSTVAKDIAAEHGVTPVPAPAPEKSEPTKKTAKASDKRLTFTEHQAVAVREALSKASIPGVNLEGRTLFIKDCPEAKKAASAKLAPVLAVLESGLPEKREELMEGLKAGGGYSHHHASLHVNNLLRSAKAAAGLLRARLGLA